MSMILPPSGYTEARYRAIKAERRGDVAAMRAWLAAAEQLLRIHRLSKEYDRAQEKHEAWRREQPQRQKWLENRTRFQP